MAKLKLGFIGSFIFCMFSFFIIPAKCQDAEVMNILKNTIIVPTSFQWTGPDVCKWKHVQCGPDKRVTAIQIGNQNLQGSLPKELSKLTALEHFECQTNALTGPFPYLSKSLQKLVIHDNKFNSIPGDFFKGMSSLQEVEIDDNPFPPWQVPNSLKDCVALQTFSAVGVGFVGTIPDFFGKDGPFPSLVFLALSRNSFEGELPTSFSGSSIEDLLVNGQNGNYKLNGTLSVLQYMTSLKRIWANLNSFTGPIPDLSHLDQLYDLNLRDNQLTGVVPPSILTLPSLKVVNLTNNNLQGQIPKFRDGVAVDNNVDSGRNRYCTDVIGQPCSPLVNALLSVIEPLGYPLNFANSWEGNDPCGKKWIGIVCSSGNISIINFQNMGLSGTISPSFANLGSVKKILLANNGITGTIPSDLTSMPNLQELDVSNNKLFGKVPLFRKDVVVKLSGNPDIGKDKPTSPNGSSSANGSNGSSSANGSNGSSSANGSSSGGGDNKTNAGLIVGIVVGVVVLLGLGALILVKFRNKLRNHEGKAKKPISVVVHPQRENVENVEGNDGASPIGNMVISIQVLREVTDDFSEDNIVGKGGFGTVYKGGLDDGTQIAVKRMQIGLVDQKGLNEFTSEIAVLTKVRHRHLVELMGYCLEGNERLLVYEYMSQGALSTHLFDCQEEGIKPLEWKTRLSIALDVARGVEYLHGMTQQTFIHRDLKPSNILLGDDMRAKVSDFGLVRLAPDGKASFQTRLAGTFGYMAPEYAATGRLTTKADVYSYGVILMEMITGRKALDDSQPEENFHLVTWFRRMQLNKDSFRTIIDPTIVVDEETYSSINTVAELAGHCSAREPYQRPDMSHVVNVLSPLVEKWNPTEPEDDAYGINFGMTLPEALQRWQALDGRSEFIDSTYSPSTMPTSGYNTNSS